jgi:hypothetical protein
MSASQSYILLSIVVLAIIAFLLVVVNKSKMGRRLTPLTGLAFALIVAGIVFGDNRQVGYGLMAGGILLAVVDMIIKWRKK